MFFYGGSIMSFGSGDKHKIYRAGVIPYYNDNGTIRMLFMKPSNSKFGGDINPETGEMEMRYQLAKGRIEKNENAQEAALREGEEEVGLKLENIMFALHVGTFLGRTEVYIAKIIDPAIFGEHHYETESTCWMTLEEFEQSGRVLHRDLVRQSHFLIEMTEENLGTSF